MNELERALLDFERLEDRRLLSIGGVTYIIFTRPYQLMKKRRGHAHIDAYYTVSNSVYFLRRELEEHLKSRGFEITETKLPYKNLASLSGLGVPTKCSLIASEKHGTLFAMEVAAVRGTYAAEMSAESLLEKPPLHEMCADCDRCERACPCGCVSEGAIYTDCLRSRQDDEGFFTSPYAAAARSQLLGCEVCRRVCPLNEGFAEREMTEKEDRLLRFEKLYESFSAGKKACEEYVELLGRNYIRPKKLLALTLNCMANSPDPSLYADCAEKSLGDSDKRVRDAAARLLAACLK